uniref:Late blight resistance protein, putative n=1 Tax=Solanum demissum TaxID=50514 RepID=Q6L436_SOLDE|nr:Late blight resistance protein, putative [Solanum demissum]
MKPLKKKIRRWMLGQIPQHPNKTKRETQNNRVLRSAKRLTTDSEELSWINGVLDADPEYLRLHHNKMQANWHQYMECTNMRAGPLTTT